eukprot:jgi/Tetstr1/447179/TSEL_034616.t1
MDSPRPDTDPDTGSDTDTDTDTDTHTDAHTDTRTGTDDDRRGPNMNMNANANANAKRPRRDDPPEPPESKAPKAPKEHPVNLFFGTAADMADLAADKDTGSQAYVILQNNQLFADNAKLRARVDKLRADKEILATDFDHLEKTKTCLRGLLHNEVEISGVREEICQVRAGDLKAVRERAYHFAGEVLLALLVLASTVAAAAADRVPEEYRDLVLTGQLSLFAGLFVATILFVYLVNLDATDIARLTRTLEDAAKASDNLHCIIDEI